MLTVVVHQRRRLPATMDPSLNSVPRRQRNRGAVVVYRDHRFEGAAGGRSQRREEDHGEAGIRHEHGGRNYRVEVHVDAPTWCFAAPALLARAGLRGDAATHRPAGTPIGFRVITTGEGAMLTVDDRDRTRGVGTG